MNPSYGFPDPQSDWPVGTVLLWTQTTTPAGWLLCDGTAVARGKYSSLYDLIGTTWGAGDGASTFGLPDLRSRMPLGAGSGSGLTSRSLAATGGAETHTLSTAEMASHTHSLAYTGAGGGAVFNYNTSSALQSGSAGSGGSHANMHPWMGINFIIRY